MTWKLTKSNLKPINEDWSISWQKGRDEIEIIKHNKKFEVWYQKRNTTGDSWDGEHLRTFKTHITAIRFARKIIKKWGAMEFIF